MKFEELESIWSAQSSPIPAAVDLAEIQRRLGPEMRRRRRQLGYELAAGLLGLLLLPVLSAANYLHDPARYGAPWQWVNLTCQFAVLMLLLGHAFQRLGRHRALRRQPVESLRGMTLVSVANLEAEMRDYRWRRPILGLVLASVVAAVVTAGLRQGWTTGLVAGLATGALVAMVGLVFRHHYRTNLYPAWVQQTKLLRELE